MSFLCGGAQSSALQVESHQSRVEGQNEKDMCFYRQSGTPTGFHLVEENFELAHLISVLKINTLFLGMLRYCREAIAPKAFMFLKLSFKTFVNQDVWTIEEAEFYNKNCFKKKHEECQRTTKSQITLSWKEPTRIIESNP
ncbi:hypothetical protein BTVI_11667 [Pitangus sulphuratus]|nr:hypothetical protein BTVI_11667 [Pitangus sulphuratus]